MIDFRCQVDMTDICTGLKEGGGELIQAGWAEGRYHKGRGLYNKQKILFCYISANHGRKKNWKIFLCILALFLSSEIIPIICGRYYF